MRLDPAVIAQLAREAGFDRDETVMATAVALGGSGGLTQYEHVYGPPGSGHLVGLWAVDVDRYPDYADVDLHDPETAARAAYQLTADHDGWGWSHVWRTGAQRLHLNMARVEASRVLYRQPARTLNSAATVGNQHAARAPQRRRMLANLVPRRTFRGH